MDNRFAVVIITLLALFVVYLDNAGRLQAAINAAKGTGAGATPSTLPTLSTTSTTGITVPPANMGPLPVVSTTSYMSLPFIGSAPGFFSEPGTEFGAPSMAGDWFG